MDSSFWLFSAVTIWIVVSGLDDLFILCCFVCKRRLPALEAFPAESVLRLEDEQRLAIFLPAWQEDAVIASMLEHNLAAIEYSNYAFFVGVYPNDAATQMALAPVAARHPNVHVCVCPHDGPTSKADCLNWVFQHLLLRESTTGESYDAVLTHDAEDLIHPLGLSVAGYFNRRYGMVQTPVLALPTPWTDLIHGLYCDDFALLHGCELPVRNLLGGFIPSSGVGTIYSRAALEALAESSSNQIFHPAALTEDYENGLRLHRLGVKQRFVPVTWMNGSPVATREYFPRRFAAALRQRTRWVTGIAFQGWQRHGWRGGWYWLWRDRKGLAGNPLSLVANGMLVCMALGWHPGISAGLVWASAGLMAVQMLVRVWFTSRVYGLGFGLLAPFRMLLGNVVNSLATGRAAWAFGCSVVLKRPLVWLKTDHAYPNLAALTEHKRGLAEVLMELGYLSRRQVGELGASESVGELAVDRAWISEFQLCEALSMQHGVEAEVIGEDVLDPNLARMLPVKLMTDWRVVPLAVEEGNLRVAVAMLPGEALEQELRRYTKLRFRFTLVTSGNLQRLVARLRS